MIVLSYSENRMIVASFFSTKHRNVTDGLTDGGTGRPVAITAVALQAMRGALKMREWKMQEWKM